MVTVDIETFRGIAQMSSRGIDSACYLTIRRTELTCQEVKEEVGNELGCVCRV